MKDNSKWLKQIKMTVDNFHTNSPSLCKMSGIYIWRKCRNVLVLLFRPLATIIASTLIPKPYFKRLDPRRTSKLLRLKLEENSCKSFSCNAASLVPGLPPFDFRWHSIRRPPNKDQSLPSHPPIAVGTLRCISRNCAIADTSDNLRADYLEKCWWSHPIRKTGE